MLQRRELWVMPVVNPDGYVWNKYVHFPANSIACTQCQHMAIRIFCRRKYFPAGQGMERKNRRPGCRSIGTQLGVDLNRNYAFHWQYDNKGSSPSQCAEVQLCSLIS